MSRPSVVTYVCYQLSVRKLPLQRYWPRPEVILSFYCELPWLFLYKNNNDKNIEEPRQLQSRRKGSKCILRNFVTIQFYSSITE